MSKTNRIKVTGPVIKSRAQAEEVLGFIRAATLRRNKQALQLEQARKALDDKHGDAIGSEDETIEKLSESVRVWAEAHPEEFGTKKSLDTIHAVIGWRIGQPTLKPWQGWTWDRVMEKLKNLGRTDLVRVKEEVNKQGILDQRDDLGANGLKDLGVRVVQDEPFFIEPKIEETENRIAA